MPPMQPPVMPPVSSKQKIVSQIQYLIWVHVLIRHKISYKIKKNKMLKRGVIGIECSFSLIPCSFCDLDFQIFQFQGLMLISPPPVKPGGTVGFALRPSVCPPVCQFVRPSHSFSALFSYTLWHIELKFCIWFCFTALPIKFDSRYFASIFVRVMPLSELRILEIRSFPHFSPTSFDILSWNFKYDFVLLHYRSSSTRVTLRQFLYELCPFLNLEY